MVYGQEDSQIYELSLEELMNLEIFSASKKSENSFDAPLSSSVITGDEIMKSGANSIAEALRLAPGIIVREKVNGNYDVHLRGFDNTPNGTGYDDAQNLISLVMIDGRIVFNYLNGGTIWNSLPIDINDVDRIEVVRGPASALYGPNAMTGVINIITKSGNSDNPGLIARTNVSTGTVGTTLANANLGYQTDKVYGAVSFNLQQRDRYTDEYYLMADQSYSELPESTVSFISGPINDLSGRYPNQSLSMDKYGINAFVEYELNDDIDFILSGGFQDAEGQYVFNDNGYTPLSYNFVSSNYVDFKSKIYGFNVHLNNINGDQEILNPARNGNIPYNTFNANVEYDIELGDLLIRPGVSYINSDYQWKPSISETQMTISSASLRADYNTGKIRFIGALRGDSYNKPDDIYFSGQLTGLYNFNDKNLLRMVYSRSNAAPFITRMYLSIEQQIPNAAGFRFTGNPDMKLQTMEMVELGYRRKVMDNLYADLEVFHMSSSDYNEIQFAGVTVEGTPPIPFTTFQYQNIDLRSRQFGTSFSLNYVPKDNLQIKAFVTVQETTLENYSLDPTDASDDSKQHLGTPGFYGGFYADYSPLSKLRINLNGYFMGESTLDRQDEEITFPVTTSVVFDDKMDAQFILNAKVSYEVVSNLQTFVNARNLTTSGNQFGFTDDIGQLFLFGLSYNFQGR